MTQLKDSTSTLTSGKLSAATMETLRVAGLDEGACAKPGLPCI